MTGAPLNRVESLCRRFGVQAPIWLAPMAGASPPSLSIAISEGGGLAACGALLMGPAEMRAWADNVRARTSAAFQMNLWVPDPSPARDRAHEDRLRVFLERWGPAVSASSGDEVPRDFAEQCEGLLEVRPAIASSIMGLFPPRVVAALKSAGITWSATVTTVKEAQRAEEAGADIIVAQGMEAGGHRGSFDAADAESRLVGLFALVPQVVDAVRVPVVATGGIADARGIAAALMLGASAVQIGTGFLRSPEAGISAAWSRALADLRPEDTMLTRAFSGRAGRAIANDYLRAANMPDAPMPAPYPVQRGLSGPMRRDAAQRGDGARMQAWAGQAARLASDEPAAELVQRLWREARDLL
ncbi:MAG: NAD(P)H-dependent flavin oxidoreductase [Steroidobacteraceae bacterium]